MGLPIFVGQGILEAHVPQLQDAFAEHRLRAKSDSVDNLPPFVDCALFEPHDEDIQLPAQFKLLSVIPNHHKWPVRSEKSEPKFPQKFSMNCLIIQACRETEYYRHFSKEKNVSQSLLQLSTIYKDIHMLFPTHQKMLLVVINMFR